MKSPMKNATELLKQNLVVGTALHKAGVPVGDFVNYIAPFGATSGIPASTANHTSDSLLKAYNAVSPSKVSVPALRAMAADLAFRSMDGVPQPVLDKSRSNFVGIPDQYGVTELRGAGPPLSAYREAAQFTHMEYALYEHGEQLGLSDISLFMNKKAFFYHKFAYDENRLNLNFTDQPAPDMHMLIPVIMQGKLFYICANFDFKDRNLFQPKSGSLIVSSRTTPFEQILASMSTKVDKLSSSVFANKLGLDSTSRNKILDSLMIYKKRLNVIDASGGYSSRSSEKWRFLTSSHIQFVKDSTTTVVTSSVDHPERVLQILAFNSPAPPLKELDYLKSDSDGKFERLNNIDSSQFTVYISNLNMEDYVSSNCRSDSFVPILASSTSVSSVFDVTNSDKPVDRFSLAESILERMTNSNIQQHSFLAGKGSLCKSPISQLTEN